MDANDFLHSPASNISIIIEPDETAKQRRLFMLGMMVLFGWMLVIVFCVYPQLFRDLMLRYVCCCFAGFAARRQGKYRQSMEKVKRAQERVRSASRSFLSVSMAANPSAILLKQVGLGENLVELGLRKQQLASGHQPLFFPEPIPEHLEPGSCTSRDEEDEEGERDDDEKASPEGVPEIRVLTSSNSDRRSIDVKE